MLPLRRQVLLNLHKEVSRPHVAEVVATAEVRVWQSVVVVARAAEGFNSRHLKLQMTLVSHKEVRILFDEGVKVMAGPAQETSKATGGSQTTVNLRRKTSPKAPWEISA
jgi:hypothetical protein